MATVRLSLRQPVLTYPICTTRIDVTRFAATNRGNIYDYKSVLTGNEILAQTFVQDEPSGLVVSVNLAALNRLCAHSLVAYINEFPLNALP